METLLSQSGILLYGRILTDITPGTNEPTGDKKDPGRLGYNKFLQNQLVQHDAKFARIYGFTYEGHYYDLAKPIVFLVHGDGIDAEELPETQQGANRRFARAPEGLDITGVASQFGSCSEGTKVWAYDKGDFSIRMEIETGPFEKILLDLELNTDRLQSHYSGQKVRIRNTRFRTRDD